MSSSKLSDYILTKTLIKSGLQCKKKLWLDFNEPKKEDVNTAIYVGNIFGKKLRELDNSGVDLSDLKYEDALEATKEAIKSNECKMIYEGVFIFDDTLIRPDVLKRSKDGWELWEAKAVKVKDEEIKDSHIKDIAIQYYVVSSCGINITKTKLVCIDDKFVYLGDNNYKNLIKSLDVTEEVKKQSKDVPQYIKDFKKLSSSSVDCPDISIGEHCKDPYPCIYKSTCESENKDKNLIDYTVLPNIRKKALKEYIDEENITTNIQDIPMNLLNPQQKIVLNSHLTGQEYLNPELKKILKKYEWPFYFMDFEFVQQFVPIIKNTKSHESIPFQWSVHEWSNIDSKVEIKDGYNFLDFSSDDIEVKFIESLLKVLKNKGTIFAHNATTEITVLKKLLAKDNCKKFKDQITEVILRIEDTYKLAKDYFYNTKMRGKYGLKQIIKSIPSSVSYEEEGAIAGGSEAQLAWFKCMDPEISNEEKEKEKKLLLEYCAKDTYALYNLVRYWMNK